MPHRCWAVKEHRPPTPPLAPVGRQHWPVITCPVECGTAHQDPARHRPGCSSHLEPPLAGPSLLHPDLFLSLGSPHGKARRNEHPEQKNKIRLQDEQPEGLENTDKIIEFGKGWPPP
ncbi:uncharacterized protein LOC144577614 [Callithrix jacchus]